ncbi:MAG TPA: hypothetical protein PLU10_08020 [Chitinophagaceae bacterium]|nr:hypothetical protein [Chitinophagaceae bacterium]
MKKIILAFIFLSVTCLQAFSGNGNTNVKHSRAIELKVKEMIVGGSVSLQQLLNNVDVTPRQVGFEFVSCNVFIKPNSSVTKDAYEFSLTSPQSFNSLMANYANVLSKGAKVYFDDIHVKDSKGQLILLDGMACEVR